jgi:sRNA-binding regulator protein Hfq
MLVVKLTNVNFNKKEKITCNYIFQATSICNDKNKIIIQRTNGTKVTFEINSLTNFEVILDSTGNIYEKLKHEADWDAWNGEFNI